jgi:hypothetical protein
MTDDKPPSKTVLRRFKAVEVRVAAFVRGCIEAGDRPVDLLAALGPHLGALLCFTREDTLDGYLDLIREAHTRASAARPGRGRKRTTATPTVKTPTGIM